MRQADRQTISPIAPPLRSAPTRHFGERATLNIYAGLVAAGQLRIADSSGKQLRQVDVGRAPLLGATFSARF